MEKKNQRSEILIGVFAALSFFLCTEVKAEIAEVSAKVGGDIYGQVKVISDVDGDGIKDLIFGSTDGKIHIYSAAGNEILRPPYWPKQVDAPVMAGIEVADLKGDGELSILASSRDNTLYCIDMKGKERWKVAASGTNDLFVPLVRDVAESDPSKVVWIVSNKGSGAGEAIALKEGLEPEPLSVGWSIKAPIQVIDTDKNGYKNVVIKDHDGMITVFDESGEVTAEWKSFVNFSRTDWPFQVGTSDIDGDGFPEIYTTDSEHPFGGSGEFNMWDAAGNLKSSFKISDAAHGAPVFADVDGDGMDDLIIAQRDGTVLVCDKNGKAKLGWPYKSIYTPYTTPVIIDIDGDGENDVVFTANNETAMGHDETKGCIIALDKKGKILDGYPKFIGKTFAPLTFADLDGDGRLEMIAAGGIGYTAPQLWVFNTKAKTRFRFLTLRQLSTIK